MRFKVARVGDLVELCREHVAVDEAKTYRQLGIYSWGKGIIRREPVPGSELSKLRYCSFPALYFAPEQHSGVGGRGCCHQLR